jgi:hypothetical protein
VSQYKRILYYKLKKFYEYNKAFGRKIIELIPKPNTNTNTNPNVNTILSHLLDKPKESNSVSKKKSERKTRVTYNSKHIGFYNIDISDVQADIEEAAQILVYFSNNVEYDLSEAESEEDDEDDEDDEENVVTNDPEVSTLEDSEAEAEAEAEEENDSDDENNRQNEELAYTEYDTESEYDYDENDSIS